MPEPMPARWLPDAEADAALVARARAGEMVAFEELYHRHKGKAYAVAYRMTSHVGRAEELTQSAFVQAWQQLAHFRGDAAFGSWLHRLVVNGVLMDLRATLRREARVGAVENLEAIAPSAAGPSPAARLDLEQAIATLPAGARAVFVLHDIEGYTHEEIARLMEVAPGTAKAQLHRARQLLKEALQ